MDAHMMENEKEEEPEKGPLIVVKATAFIGPRNLSAKMLHWLDRGIAVVGDSYVERWLNCFFFFFFSFLSMRRMMGMIPSWMVSSNSNTE